ncbi:MAG TPA: PIN domain-containing protein [Mycobacterium sp.]|nr:PIN domain-containing protein [Mycobacterium sp.]
MIVVDTGPLVALLDADDAHHERCRTWLATAQGPLIVPVPVVTETCYFIERDSGPGTEADFLDSFGLGGPFEMADLGAHEWKRVSDLIRTYADLPLGVIDASVVAVAERVGASTLASLDHRHFSVVRPAHVPSFELVP